MVFCKNDVATRKLANLLNNVLLEIQLPTEQPRKTRMMDAAAWKMSEWNVQGLFVSLTLFHNTNEIARLLDR
jgi:hypothetical protein